MSDSSTPETHTAAPPRWTRRSFLAGMGFGVLGAAGCAQSLLVEPHWISLDERELPLPDLPPALSGLRIAQLTDIHYRGNDDYLAEIVQQTQNLRPEMIVLTGDFIDEAEYLDPLIAHLGALPEAPLGRWAVLGNHDYYSGISPERWRRALERIGIRLLVNADAEVVRNNQVLRIAGLDDGIVGRPDHALFETVAEYAAPTIGLIHEPALWRPDQTATPLLTLAGHTHGGQVRIPFIGAPVLPLGSKSYDLGVFRDNQFRAMHVSAGLGWFLLPIRFACRPAINLLTLRPA